LEGEVCIGIVFAEEYRFTLSFMIEAQESPLAEPLIEQTEEGLRKGSWPIRVSEGMNAYGGPFKIGIVSFRPFPERAREEGRVETNWSNVTSRAMARWSKKGMNGAG
jgi:hypothetical protein